MDECNNSNRRSISKKPIDADYSVWPTKLRRILKHLNLKLGIESGLESIKIFLAKGSSNLDQQKYLLLNFC